MIKLITEKYRTATCGKVIHALRNQGVCGFPLLSPEIAGRSTGTYCGVELRSKRDLIETEGEISCGLCLRAIEAKEIGDFVDSMQDLIRLPKCKNNTSIRLSLLIKIASKQHFLREIARRMEERGEAYEKYKFLIEIADELKTEGLID